MWAAEYPSAFSEGLHALLLKDTAIWLRKTPDELAIMEGRPRNARIL